jgi:hypothetical protein
MYTPWFTMWSEKNDDIALGLERWEESEFENLNMTCKYFPGLTRLKNILRQLFK